LNISGVLLGSFLQEVCCLCRRETNQPPKQSNIDVIQSMLRDANTKGVQDFRANFSICHCAMRSGREADIKVMGHRCQGVRAVAAEHSSRDQLRTQKCIRLMPKAEATKLGPVHFLIEDCVVGYDRNAANEVAESREYDSRLGRTSNHFRANASQRRNVRWDRNPSINETLISIGDSPIPNQQCRHFGRAIATFRTQTSGLKIDDYNVAGQHVNRFWSKIHIALHRARIGGRGLVHSS
jgi:hypothetical protein